MRILQRRSKNTVPFFGHYHAPCGLVVVHLFNNFDSVGPIQNVKSDVRKHYGGLWKCQPPFFNFFNNLKDSVDTTSKVNRPFLAPGIRHWDIGAFTSQRWFFEESSSATRRIFNLTVTSTNRTVGFGEVKIGEWEWIFDRWSHRLRFPPKLSQQCNCRQRS